MSDHAGETSRLRAFADWVNADSADIPPEIVYPERSDDHGHDEHADEGLTPDEPAVAAAAAVQEEVHDTPPARRKAPAPAVSAAADAPKSLPDARLDRWDGLYQNLCLLSGLLIAMILLITVAALPQFGGADNPAINEVSTRYLEQGLSETGAVNAVAAMILDYRAFDTLGETVVLFAATVAVLFLLTQTRRQRPGGRAAHEANHTDTGVRSLPSKIVIRTVFPFIMLYGIYVVCNGHLSPGGGFSGGTILGGGMVLAHLAFGDSYTQRYLTTDRCAKIIAGGLGVYIILKTYHVLTGANGMDSAIPLGIPGSIFSGGLIFPLNICVGLIVACTIYALYSLFTGWSTD